MPMLPLQLLNELDENYKTHFQYLEVLTLFIFMIGIYCMFSMEDTKPRKNKKTE